MDNKQHVSYIITDRSHAHQIKKDVRVIAETVKFNLTRLAEIDILVSELLTNLIKHSPLGGELLVKPFIHHGEEGLEIICMDHGPGIPDLPRMMTDGSSTAGTLGQGLGAIKRLSDTFEIYSLKDWGTIILSRKYKKGKVVKSTDKFKIGAILVPKPGEVLCGDGWAYKIQNNRLKIIMVDGLGHGPEAYLAAQQSIDYFMKSTEVSPAAVIKSMHQEVKKTRGVVGVLAYIDVNAQTMQMCGIGNINARLSGFFNAKVLMSYNGIIGHNIPNRVHDQPVEMGNALLILCSDGIKERWDLMKHPTLSKFDISMTAAVIYIA